MKNVIPQLLHRWLGGIDGVVRIHAERMTPNRNRPGAAGSPTDEHAAASLGRMNLCHAARPGILGPRTPHNVRTLQQNDHLEHSDERPDRHADRVYPPLRNA